MDNQERDFSWFICKYNELYEKYGHKFLAIKGRKVIGVFEDEVEAIKNTAETEDFGTFIIQECNGSESGYTKYVTHIVADNSIGYEVK